MVTVAPRLLQEGHLTPPSSSCLMLQFPLAMRTSPSQLASGLKAPQSGGPSVGTPALPQFTGDTRVPRASWTTALWER